jgi:predicted MFS family arabinose efflux permease
MPALIGPMMGPVVGGFITQYFHWRWIFLINLPIGVFGFFLVTRLIKELPIQRPPRFDLPGFLIVGVGFAFAQFWLECLGRGVISPPAEWALFIGAGVAFFLYVRYAANQVNPVLDLKLFKIPTFRISIWWGSLSRIGIGGTPFLLPLLLQVGFGLDPLHAGIMVFVSISGAFFMRLGFSRVLRKLGLRRALIMNSGFLAALLVGFLFISPTTPHWFLYIYFFVVGFFRSVQFISLNMSSFGDLPTESMSKGNTIFTISHRLSMGIGTTVAAVALAGFGIQAPGSPPHFHLAFITLAVIEAASIFGLWRLHPSAGREITG